MGKASSQQYVKLAFTHGLFRSTTDYISKCQTSETSIEVKLILIWVTSGPSSEGKKNPTKNSRIFVLKYMGQMQI